MIKTRLIGLLSHSKKYVIYQMLWKYVALICQIVTVYYFVDILTVTRQSNFFMAFLPPVVSLLIRCISEKKVEEMTFRASVDVKRVLRGKIYEKLLSLGASYRTKVATAELVQLSTEGVEQLETYFGRYLSQFLYSLTSPILLFLFLVRYNFRGSVCLLIGVPLLPISIMIVQKIAKRLLSKYWGVYANLGDSFLENLQGLTTLKIYKADEKKAEQMDTEAEHFRVITMKVLQMQLNSIIVMDVVAYGGAAMGMAVTVIEYLKENVTAFGALMTILLAAEFFLPLRRLGSLFHVAMNGMAASDRIFKLLDLDEGDVKKENLKRLEDLEFTIEHVDFSYNETRQIVHDISIRIPSRSFVSIVGESGSGKSTIAALLMGRNRGYKGSIRIGEQELRDISEQQIFENVCYVSHESYIFTGTIRSNLLQGKENATDEEMQDVLARVNLLSFGLDKEITERGENLSGGERQRLALARALLHDASVYIFDEATSNIDVESEALIQMVIHELAKTKTVLMITHRLANVIASDRIFMLKDGRIVEEGTHEELMAKKGMYQEMYCAQDELENYGKNSAQQVSVTKIRSVRGKEETTSETSKRERRRSGISIMSRLIGLVKPLMPFMIISISLGVIGYLCAIFLTILAARATFLAVSGSLRTLVLMGCLRGVFHYIEQWCNHYIAFRLLAIIRHKVFAKLRELSPAKLEGRDRGNLIALITSDIELLEVFYAHTISPIAIAIIVSLIMCGFIGSQSVIAGVIAFEGYIVVGMIIPLVIGKLGGSPGLAMRNDFGRLNSFVLDSLYGIDETLQYGRGRQRKEELDVKSRTLAEKQMRLNMLSSWQTAITTAAILVFSLFVLGATNLEYGCVYTTWMAAIAMMGSFGPVSALSSLSNDLNQTLASGERVLSLLEEDPVVHEVKEGKEVNDKVTFEAVNVDFAYPKHSEILHDCSMKAEHGKITGIVGPSGCGKSTLMKLMMRFRDVNSGKIRVADQDVREIATSRLRDLESLVTQETVLFHTTILDNIRIAKFDATDDEVVEAAKKAALHDFVADLPDHYDTVVGEQGCTLSGGERQRIGIARAFLHDSPSILLDEPTSNLDSLNEGIILKALKQASEDRTIILVSHRKSTRNIADAMVEFDSS